MSKHTPGPWMHMPVTSSDDGRYVYCLVGPERELRKNMGVAYAGTYGKTRALKTGRIRLSDEECEANARLIAAAPDLLTEASFLLDRLAELEIPEELARDWCGHVEPSIERLRRIIAKATGNP